MLCNMLLASVACLERFPPQLGENDEKPADDDGHHRVGLHEIHHLVEYILRG